MSPSNGRPEPEVIVNFADGCSYSKGKLEEAFRPGGVLSENQPKSAKAIEGSANVKKEDVDAVVKHFEIPRTQAEKALATHNGDLKATLRALVGI